MRGNSRCLQSPADCKSGHAGRRTVAAFAGRTDAEQDVPLIVHVHDYVHVHVHVHVQNGICTQWKRTPSVMRFSSHHVAEGYDPFATA